MSPRAALCSAARRFKRDVTEGLNLESRPLANVVVIVKTCSFFLRKDRGGLLRAASTAATRGLRLLHA